MINCTGYGARALLGDETMVPMRGQIAWLIPQREFDYGVSYHGVNVVPRTDGIGVQAVSGGDMRGCGDETPCRTMPKVEQAVATIATLYGQCGR